MCFERKKNRYKHMSVFEEYILEKHVSVNTNMYVVVGKNSVLLK
jgi:hypothetical protein